MKLKLALIAAAATLASAAPASAATVLGDLGATGVSYGTLTGTGFTAYDAHSARNPLCLGLGSCYTGGDKYAIIAASGNPDELLVHPGPGFGGNSAVLYSASTAGTYNLSALATSADVGGKTIGYFSIIGGVLSTFDVGSIAAVGSSLTIGENFTLAAGDSIGVFVNNGPDGVYYNDSTHLSGTISAVPEASTWAMMLAGFGMIGFAARRRQQSVRVTYA